MKTKLIATIVIVLMLSVETALAFETGGTIVTLRTILLCNDFETFYYIQRAIKGGTRLHVMQFIMDKFLTEKPQFFRPIPAGTKCFIIEAYGGGFARVRLEDGTEWFAKF